jgi:hypothetical protein
MMMIAMVIAGSSRSMAMPAGALMAIMGSL